MRGEQMRGKLSVDSIYMSGGRAEASRKQKVIHIHFVSEAVVV